jgi:hypothetical protein
MKVLAMALAFATAACATTAAVHEPGSIGADVALSEWTAPGHVSLDLATGRYALDPQPPRGPAGAARPPTRRGRLHAADLAAIRGAFDTAFTQGLIDPACASGGPPPRIVVSNAATPVLALTRGTRTLTAPGNLGCWTEAANRLQGLLEGRFDAEARRRR